MKKTLSQLLLISVLGTSAYAGCSPSCSEGETCRYEAAGGKFYCAPSKVASGSKKAKRKGINIHPTTKFPSKIRPNR